MAKPQFNTALGALNWTLQPNLPARFKGVTARIFPLKARMDLLRAFCNSYLNIADTIVQFQPALPYVYLMVLNYGQMSAEVENFGWVSQHEVAFAVPIEWYRVENGRPVFVDSAAVCPFIFVDNELSLSTGREVYGWPKVKASLEPEISPWLADPRYDMHLLSLSTMLYPKLFAGQRQQREVLLQIRQRPLPSFSRFPPDPANPLSLLMRLPTAMMSGLTLLGQILEMATRLPLLGYDDRSGRPPLASVLSQGLRALNLLSSPAPSNQITLKQFRDAEHPARACYQAIVNSTIHTLRFNAGGVLGEPHILSGDLSGGFEILVHRYTAQPIIESLGLDVARETAVSGNPVAALAPVFPFWIDVDLEYGIGEALCWRTRDSDWQTDGESSPPPQPQEHSAIDEDGSHGHPFNTALGAAMQDVAGPFDFPNTTVRVLPLMADAGKLERLCEDYLNAGNDLYRFKPWGSYVYLVVTNYEEMSSSKANLGFWAEREVTFFIPVKCYDAGDPPKLLSVALVPVFDFADSGTGAITSREVNGRPTLTAAIKSPSNSWMTESGPSKGENERLLALETTVFPAMRLGQRAEWQTLVEIVGYQPLRYNDDVSWRAVADVWGQALLSDHAEKIERKRKNPRAFDDARALAVEILANRQPINVITLKQFRDVVEPLSACYQALVLGRREIDVAFDMREIEDCIHVGIYRYPSLPIVEKLGLQTKWTTTGAEVVDVLQPLRPFWIRLSLKDYLGENLCWRADEKWIPQPHAPFYFESPDPADGAGAADAPAAAEARLTQVGRGLVARLDQRPRFGEPYCKKQRVRLAATDWLREAQQMKKPDADHERLTRSEAAEAVEAIDPQMIVESILSKEWLNWGNPRWYQPGGVEEKPDFCIPMHSIGENSTQSTLLGTGDDRWPGWYSEDAPPEETKPPGKTG